jgi:hypothetical protein
VLVEMAGEMTEGVWHGGMTSVPGRYWIELAGMGNDAHIGE